MTDNDLAAFTGQHAVVNPGRPVTTHQTFVNNASSRVWSITTTDVYLAGTVGIGRQQWTMSCWCNITRAASSCLYS